jgi:acid phosphatase class B
MKMQQPLNKQTLLKSNAQLRREDSDEDIPAAMHVAFPDVASSSHTVPPSEPEVNVSQIMEALAALQGGMSNMQVSMSSMQLEMRSISKRVEQTHLDLQECLQVHHPDSSDDEAAAPKAARRTPRATPMAEDV